MIKKIITVLFVATLFLGCEEIPNDVIEIQTVDYVIENISAPSEVIFKENNILQTSMKVNNFEDIKKVWFSIDTLNGAFSISPNIGMESNNNNLYVGKFEFHESVYPGTYEIKYYIKDNINVDGENVRKVGSRLFDYKIEKGNIPPKIMEYNIYDNAVQGGYIIVSVRAIDQNGPDDIKSVYFELFYPNGTQVTSSDSNTQFLMFDNGNSTNGDLVANDGIFSSKYALDSLAVLGDWKIVVYAIDKQDSISKPIETLVNVEVNVAPEIGNLDMPGQINKGTPFVIKLDVTDGNGLSNIERVYYQLKDSEGNLIVNSKGISKFPLFDNGDTDRNGDVTENDGTFTIIVPWPNNNDWLGTWTFSFNAEDKAKAISNTITQNLEVK